MWTYTNIYDKIQWCATDMCMKKCSLKKYCSLAANYYYLRVYYQLKRCGKIEGKRVEHIEVVRETVSHLIG